MGRDSPTACGIGGWLSSDSNPDLHPSLLFQMEKMLLPESPSRSLPPFGYCRSSHRADSRQFNTRGNGRIRLDERRTCCISKSAHPSAGGTEGRTLSFL